MKRKIFTFKERKKVHKKYGKRCAYCGDKITYPQMQIDHIVPMYNYELFFRTWITTKFNRGIPEFLLHLKMNDVNHFDNLNPSCRVCNKAKDTFSLEVFRSELESQLDRAFKQSSNYRRALKFNQVKETRKPIIFHFEKIRK